MAEPASAVADLARRFDQTVASFVKEHRLPGAAAVIGVTVGPFSLSRFDPMER